MRWLALLLLAPAVAGAELGGIQIPSEPDFPSGRDSVRTSDGVRCERTTAPRRWYMDAGVMATHGGGLGAAGTTIIETDDEILDQRYGREGYGVYARVVINLGRVDPPPRCNRLLELEIQRLEAEIRYLEMGQGVSGQVPD